MHRHAPCLRPQVRWRTAEVRPHVSRLVVEAKERLERAEESRVRAIPRDDVLIVLQILRQVVPVEEVQTGPPRLASPAPRLASGPLGHVKELRRGAIAVLRGAHTASTAPTSAGARPSQRLAAHHMLAQCSAYSASRGTRSGAAREADVQTCTSVHYQRGRYLATCAEHRSVAAVSSKPRCPLHKLAAREARSHSN